jgi:sugar lactone lactonase YvrE
MKNRSFLIAFGICVVAQGVLAGCTAKGSGTPVTPIPPSQTHLYVFNAPSTGGSIVSFPIAAAGNVAPVTSISGNLTGLNAPLFGTIDARGSLYAPNLNASSVTTYVAGSTGNEGPVTDLAGPYTGLGQPAGVAVAASGDYYVTNSAYGSPYTSVTEYAAGSTGNAVPLATIRGVATTLDTPAAIALDASNYIYVSNGIAASSGGWIAVFAPNSNGNIAPARVVQGGSTGLNGPTGVALDASGDLYVCNRFGNSVTVYAAGANGNVAPLRTISGSKTGLNAPAGLVVDSNGYLYVANNNAPSITVYAAGATGNVMPIRTISGTKTGLSKPYGVALY